jgi:hypothetical protein
MPIRVVTYCMIVEGAANETVVFRPVGGGAAYKTVAVTAGEVRAEALNANVPASGVEVLTSSVAGDVSVDCVYTFIPG